MKLFIMEKKEITPTDIAKLLGVEERYLEVLEEQALRNQHIQEELKKTEEDFFNSDPVDIPK